MSESSEFLSVRGLSKHFGGIQALDGVDFHVEEGEIVSIIGPNGAGKTTVFNLLTGLYVPDGGHIRFRGEEMAGKSSMDILQAGIGRTFQNIRLFSEMRVIENVLVGRHTKLSYGFFSSIFRAKRYKKEEDAALEQAEALLSSVGLGNRLNDYASDLPYGDRRKLEIVRAMATGAKLLLLDEPAAGMNPSETAELMHFIKSLRDKGFTILLIEHDMSVVMHISHRIYVLDYGKQIAHGLPSEIVRHPRVIEAYLGGEEYA